jgi:hypothetical protein
LLTDDERIFSINRAQVVINVFIVPQIISHKLRIAMDKKRVQRNAAFGMFKLCVSKQRLRGSVIEALHVHRLLIIARVCGLAYETCFVRVVAHVAGNTK